jgi:hypothetical protein
MPASHPRLKSIEFAFICVCVCEWTRSLRVFAFRYNDEAISLITNSETHVQRGTEFGQRKRM